jgi:hypothetical protein
MIFVVKKKTDLKQSGMILIDNQCELIEDFFGVSNKREFSSFLGKRLYGEYLGDSRIDGYPIFKIDTLQLERDEKISRILK